MAIHFVGPGGIKPSITDVSSAEWAEGPLKNRREPQETFIHKKPKPTEHSARSVLVLNIEF
jgi:hypothetical protein